MSRIPINLIETRQIKSKPVFVGTINYDQLVKFAKITFRTENGDNYYQRKIDVKRLAGIYNFMLENYNQKENLIIFPTPIIIACSLDVVEFASEEMFKENKDDLSTSAVMIRAEGNPCVKLTIPVLEHDKPLFIVDGQHRFEAVRKFKANFPDAVFEFSVVLLLDYDLFEQARIFANVNFNQKPVNRSLYYDIFGSLPDSPSDIKLAHFLASHLNKNENSPLRNMIKMLGTGSGIISQAFFVETLTKLFSERKGSGLAIIFNQYSENNKDYKLVLPLIENYFRFINNNFTEYWPQKNNMGIYSVYYYKHYLLKTTGIYVLLNLLDFILTDSKKIIEWSDYSTLEKDLTRKFKNILDNKDEFFGPVSKFAGTAGKGLQKKLLEELKSKLLIDS